MITRKVRIKRARLQIGNFIYLHIERNLQYLNKEILKADNDAFVYIVDD